MVQASALWMHLEGISKVQEAADAAQQHGISVLGSWRFLQGICCASMGFGMSTIALVLCTLAVFAAARSTTPSFCGSADCPPFTVVERGTDYELRKYPRATWATVAWRDSSYDSAMRSCVQRLLAYIGGDNAAGRKIPMTAPVLGKVGQSSQGGRTFEFSFYVPNTAIAPLSGSDVSITETPEDLEVYVMSFGGYAYGSDWDNAVDTLSRKLHADGAGHDADKFFTAVYDSPWHLINRHNEVWIMKQDAVV